jgi:hypothetical protein
MASRERLIEELKDFVSDESYDADERNHASLLRSKLTTSTDAPLDVPVVPPGN